MLIRNKMLSKYRYNNKVRYHFLEKKKRTLSWERDSKENLINNVYKNWSGKLFFKNKDMNKVLYASVCARYSFLKGNQRQKTRDRDWAFQPSYFWKKRPFMVKLTDRKDFIENVLVSINSNDSVHYIKNSLYYLYEKNVGLNQVLDVLNFSWLYEYKESIYKYDSIEKYTRLSIKSFYKGFLRKGLKYQCEKRFTSLLILLKKKLNKSGLNVMSHFISKLKPLIGFRRRRLGRRDAKKKDVRFAFKLYSHNWRWKSQLFKRFCLNSPFYQKKTAIPSVYDVYNGLIQSLYYKGPIVKCLVSYYKLIKRRTPYATRKKKKNKHKNRAKKRIR